MNSQTQTPYLDSNATPPKIVAKNNATVVRYTDGITLFANDGENRINIQYHNDDGLTITINDETYEFDAQEAQSLTINTGQGTDQLTLTEDTLEPA